MSLRNRAIAFGLFIAILLGVSYYLWDTVGKYFNDRLQPSDNLYAVVPLNNIDQFTPGDIYARGNMNVPQEVSEAVRVMSLELAELRRTWANEVKKLRELYEQYQWLLQVTEQRHATWQEQRVIFEHAITNLDNKLRLLQDNVISKDDLQHVQQSLDTLQRQTEKLANLILEFDTYNVDDILNAVEGLTQDMVDIREWVRGVEQTVEQLRHNSPSNDVVVQTSGFSGSLDEFVEEFLTRSDMLRSNLDSIDQIFSDYLLKLEGRVADIETKLADYDTRLGTVEVVLQGTQQKVAHLEEQVSHLATTANSLKDDLSRTEARINNVETSLESMLQAWEAKLQAIVENYEGMEETREKVWQLVHEHGKVLTQLNTSIVAINADIQGLQTRLQGLGQRELESLENQNALAELAVAISNLDNRLTELANRNLILEEQIVELLHAVEEVKEVIAEHETRFERDIASLRSHIDETIKNINASVEQRFGEIDSLLAGLDSKYDELVTDVYTKYAQLSATSQQLLTEGNASILRASDDVIPLIVETLHSTQELLATMTLEQEQLKQILAEQSATIELLRQEVSEVRQLQSGKNDVVAYSGGGTP